MIHYVVCHTLATTCGKFLRGKRRWSCHHKELRPRTLSTRTFWSVKSGFTNGLGWLPLTQSEHQLSPVSGRILPQNSTYSCPSEPFRCSTTSSSSWRSPAVTRSSPISHNNAQSQRFRAGLGTRLQIGTPTAECVWVRSYMLVVHHFVWFFWYAKISCTAVVHSLQLHCLVPWCFIQTNGEEGVERCGKWPIYPLL